MQIIPWCSTRWGRILQWCCILRESIYPSPPPFPLMHVDTRWKFKAMYEFRDMMAKGSGMDLIVRINPEGVEKNINPFDHGSALHTDIEDPRFKTGPGCAQSWHGLWWGETMKKKIARKSDFFFQKQSHRWDPKTSARKFGIFITAENQDESVRVFLYRSGLSLISGNISTARTFQLFHCTSRLNVQLCRNGMLIMVDDDRMKLLPDELLKQPWFVLELWVTTRNRSWWSLLLICQMVLELLQSRTSEREGRQ